MKTTIFNKKALAFFGAAAILLAAVFTTGCKTDTGSGDPAPETFTVEMTAGEHGTLSASPVIPAGGKVVKDTVITFTATPADGYGVDKWTITGGTFEAGTSTDGSTTAKVKITANTTVKVSFYKEYVKVALADLDNHLKNAAPDTDGIYYIEVTGLTAADLKGDNSSYPLYPSRLGKILKYNPTKKVALKLSEVSGLTDMSYCFYNCESLIQAPEIPSSVTDMYSCFSGCKRLTQAPMIPSGVTYMSGCFFNCESLTQAPAIPSGVTDMNKCFYGCKSLTQAPAIPSGVTNMGSCFYNCKSLTQAPAIPSGVTDMSWCFKHCKSLTQAPVIPSGVTNMNQCFYGCEKITAVTLKCNYNSQQIDGIPAFNYAFKDCKALTANSIKVPAGQLQAYKDNAGMMGTTANRFVAE